LIEVSLLQANPASLNRGRGRLSAFILPKKKIPHSSYFGTSWDKKSQQPKRTGRFKT